MSSRVDRGGAFHPFVELTLARLREFLREPEALFWTFVFPIALSLALAVAFPNRAERPVVVGLAPEAASQALRVALEGRPGVTVRAVSEAEEAGALRDGLVQIVVRPGVAGGAPVYRFDPAREESRVARLVVDDALKRQAGRVDPWTAADEPVTIAGSRYIDWLLPGIIGMNIMGSSLWGLGFSIVQLRLRKLLKRLAASPMRRWEFLLAQIAARLIFLAGEVAVPLAFGVLVFDVPVAGSAWTIGVVTTVGALAFSGIGLLVAARPRTFEAVSGVLNLVMLPMWILGGIFFATSNFPAAVQPWIQALPLTALNDALRAVILEGRSLAGVRHELLLLAAWGIVPFALAVRLFRWR